MGVEGIKVWSRADLKPNYRVPQACCKPNYDGENVYAPCNVYNEYIQYMSKRRNRPGPDFDIAGRNWKILPRKNEDF